MKYSGINETPVIDFQKELEIRKISQLLRDSFSLEYVSSLLYQIQQRLHPEQQPEPLQTA